LKNSLASRRLFREEALGSQRQRLYGTIVLESTSLRGIGLSICAGMLISVIAFFWSFGFARKESVSGVVVPEAGLWRIASQQTGLVVERRVSEGDLVKQGDVIYVISSEKDSMTRGSTQAAIGASLVTRVERLKSERARQQAQATQQAASLVLRRNALDAQVEQITKEIALQLRRIAIADASLRRLVDLQTTGFVSEAQVNDKSADLIDQQSRLGALERNKASLKSDLEIINADLRDLPLRSNREASAIDRAMAELDQGIAENESQRRAVVIAGMSGRVTALAASPGQFVFANQNLATILPGYGSLEAELYVPTRAIGFVKPGTKALLRYHAFPYQKFGQYEGVVKEVSSSAMPPAEISPIYAKDPSSTEPMYRVRVKIAEQYVKTVNGEEAIKVGMQLDSSLVLEYRRLYEWIIDPILGMAGRL
jgi:membrane fusion protein